MPLNSKGKKILASMEKQYGSKKGKSVFYAMENSGKLKGILKAKGGADASKADFGTGVSARDAGMGMAGKTGKSDPSLRSGLGGTDRITTNPNPKSGPVTVPTIGPLTAGFNLISRTLYNQKNLADARKNDPLGGEMLTTQKTTGPAGNNGDGGARQMCADGTVPPCKAPTTYTAPAKKQNSFLSGFQAYENGGEVIVSANVDEDLL